MSEVKVNKISPRTNCGTVQLGDSGDTITIPSGATITNNGTQTGFGRTGPVDWDTTAKTASFTAVSGNGYFVNTTSAAITLTLPASPSAGDIVAVKDYAFTFATNNLTVNGNGSPIGGVDGTINPFYDTNGTSKTFIYVDGTKGWLVVNESTDTSQELSPTFICATGGTITTCGDYKIHTFTGPGTFCVSCAGNPSGSTSVDYLTVAGGGGGGGDVFSTAGGGGGAGGFRYSAETYTSPSCAPGHPLRSPTGLPVSAQSYPITVGSGGAAGAGPKPNDGTQGGSSVFSTITSAGGGFGNGAGAPETNAGDGGSGGGARNACAGSGNTPPVSPPQGNPGGASSVGSPTYASGGGGGATAAGSNGSAPVGGGPGGAGAGLPTAFGSNGEPSGSFRYYSGGGGGAIWTNIPAPQAAGPYGQGGLGGGGCGGQYTSPGVGVVGVAGTANTGGGGGGASGGPSSPNITDGGNGGSGIVVIRYKFQ